jgi:small subunit ribosomal protein S15
LEKLKTSTIISDNKRGEKDTGSTEVQVALLTARIAELTGHLTANKHDTAAQRGLMQLVGHRRKLLAYLSREDVDRYHALIAKLNLRK